MHNKWMIILSLMAGLLISACSQAEALPTAVEFPTDVPPTATTEATTAPTDEPTERPTLPPTWTPTTEVTETPIPTETEVPVTETPLPAPDSVSSACDNFAVDFDRSIREFVVGESPVAAWTSIDGAVLFRVFLYDSSLRTLKDDIYTDQTSWTFDPNSFELGKNYFWSVWPLDAIGDQMCFERGTDLIPQRVPATDSP